MPTSKKAKASNRSSSSSARQRRLAGKGGMSGTILSARRALDALTSGVGFTNYSVVAISLFASFAQEVANRMSKPREAEMAKRMNQILDAMVDEQAIDEEVLDQMKAEFMQLAILVKSCPLTVLQAIQADLQSQPGIEGEP